MKERYKGNSNYRDLLFIPTMYQFDQTQKTSVCVLLLGVASMVVIIPV